MDVYSLTKMMTIYVHYQITNMRVCLGWKTLENPQVSCGLNVGEKRSISKINNLVITWPSHCRSHRNDRDWFM